MAKEYKIILQNYYFVVFFEKKLSLQKINLLHYVSFSRVNLHYFPPLAILDKGCGSFLIVFLLTLCGWVPGVIAALIINNKH